MASKTISLERSAYERLAAAKRPGESFSDVVKRLTQKGEPSILDLVGVLPKEAGDALKDDLFTRREAQERLEQERRRRFWPET